MHVFTPKPQCEPVGYSRSPYLTAPAKHAGYITAQSQDSESTIAKSIRRILRERERRCKFFDAALFADPAWDMLLELFLAEMQQARLSVGSLCIGARVPPTTALRWIGKLYSEGLVIKRSDLFDARRVYVELSSTGSKAMRGYFGISSREDFLEAIEAP